jgi:hypothetical protein
VCVCVCVSACVYIYIYIFACMHARVRLFATVAFPQN